MLAIDCMPCGEVCASPRTIPRQRDRFTKPAAQLRRLDGAPRIRRRLALLAALAALCLPPLPGNAGIISTIAGNGNAGFEGDDGQATAASLNAPAAVAVDAVGNVFIADQLNHRVRRVDAVSGVITTVAGTGIPGFSGDGGAAVDATLRNPRGLGFDSAGNLYIVDLGNHAIRRVSAANGNITTVAGTGNPGYNGDGIQATTAQLSNPRAVACDADDNLYIADQANLRVRRVDAVSGSISTFAGTGELGLPNDGGPATAANLQSPFGLAFDADGNLYIVDQAANRVRRVAAATGFISTFAGTGVFGYNGDGNPATATNLSFPSAGAFDSNGNLFIAEIGSERVRRVDAVTGIVSTAAGNGIDAFSGDGGEATAASISNPFGVALDTGDDLYIADTGNERIRRVAEGCDTAVDRDCDGWANDSDNCPYFANADQLDTDTDGRGDACECGDQNLDGRNTVSDIVEINKAIFNPPLATPLCDANNDQLCNVSDIVSVNVEIFSPTNTSICARQPFPGP